MTDARNNEIVEEVFPGDAYPLIVGSRKMTQIIERARQQGRDDADLKAGKDGGYFYRRALFAEEGLRSLVEMYDRQDYLCDDPSEIAGARTILAESRKKELPNYEDFIRNRRQTQVLNWAKKAFGTPEATALFERALRMIEEAVEVYQWACCAADVDPDDAADRVLLTTRRVFAKQPGEPRREFGGLMVTVMCLAECHGISLSEAERDEFARVLSISPAQWRERHAKKHGEGITARPVSEHPARALPYGEAEARVLAGAAATDWRCPKCGAQADERFDCCEVKEYPFGPGARAGRTMEQASKDFVSPPDAPWPAGEENAKREGWKAFYAGIPISDCPFPPARADLKKDFEYGWSVARQHSDAVAEVRAKTEAAASEESESGTPP